VGCGVPPSSLLARSHFTAHDIWAAAVRAYHFGDAIYQRLTGDTGYFGQPRGVR